MKRYFVRFERQSDWSPKLKAISIYADNTHEALTHATAKMLPENQQLAIDTFEDGEDDVDTFTLGETWFAEVWELTDPEKEDKKV